MVARDRSKPRWAAALVVVALTAAGCSGTSTQDTTSDSSDAAGASSGAEPAVLALGLDGLPDVLAPAATTSQATYLVTNQMFDPLVRLDPVGGKDIVPALAESWEVSPDGLTYTFDLREGVTFHDGEPFDAEAVALNHERLSDPESPSYWAQGAEVATAQVLNRVASLEVIDDHTVAMTLVEPFPDFPDNLARPYFMFISPASIRDLSPDEAARASIGTGPFKLVERTDDTLIRLEAFDDYYEGRPAIDELLVRPYSDSAALTAALESGEVDLITSVSYDEVNRLESAFDPWQYGTDDAYIVAFNTQHPFTSDARVRQALNLAVNKDAIVDGLFTGHATPAVGPFSPSNRAFDEARTAYQYDAARAEDLLADAGYAEGASIKAVIPSDIGIPLVPEMAQTIQADWAAVGVDVEFDTVEWNAYLDLVGGGIPDDYAFYITTWGATYPGWLELLHSEASLPPDGPNRGYYVNQDVEELFDQARGEQDTDTRIDLYRQAENLIVEDAPWLYTVYVRFTGLKDPAVDGIREEMVSFDLAKATIEQR